MHAAGLRCMQQDSKKKGLTQRGCRSLRLKSDHWGGAYARLPGNLPLYLHSFATPLSLLAGQKLSSDA